jgi:hypothetical protein
MVRAGAVPPKRNRIRRVFDEARELVNIREECYALYGNAMGVIPRKPADRIVELESNLKYINTYFNNDPNFRASSKAIEAIHSGLNAALLASQYRSDSTNGRFFVIESGKDSAKFAIQAFKARNQGSAQREQTWQVRRFIDVMSAKKHKQPWPPLKWTK